MGATLQIASQKLAYTLTDNATFTANAAKLQLARWSRVIRSC